MRTYLREEGEEMAYSSSSTDDVNCENCGNPIDACMCVCPYCGQKDSCECCLYDAATGGG